MACPNLNFITIADQILDLIYAHSNSFRPISRPDSHAANRNKIQAFMENGQPIHFVLPAFPAKSPNRQKTLGPLPDLAEVEGLRMLNDLSQSIRSIYSPGAKILICSDGRVFADVVQVSDIDVENYKRGIENLIRVENFDHLDTFHLEDVFGSQSFGGMRDRLVAKYAIPLEQLKENMHSDSSLKLMFNGIHRFMFEDQLVLAPELSREKARQKSKALTYQVIQRSNAWSALVEEKFPSSLRLSIHPQVPESTKIGVQLVHAQNGWCTPWHNVLVVHGQKKTLMKRSEAEAMGAQLRFSPKGHAFYEC